MPSPVPLAEPEGRIPCSRPSCAVWTRDPSATRWEVGWPRPATSSSSPSLPGAHSRVSLPPIPLPSRPACRGVSAAGGGEDSNQSQAGNSSRGARPSCGSEGGPGAEPGSPPAPPSSEPAPRIMETGPPADPRAPLHILASGDGRGTKARPPPSGLLAWVPRPSVPSSCFGTSTAPLQIGLIFLGGGRGAGSATPLLILSALGARRIPILTPPP